MPPKETWKIPAVDEFVDTLCMSNIGIKGLQKLECSGLALISSVLHELCNNLGLQEKPKIKIWIC